MKYYKLENSLEVSVIGKYPQSKESKNTADINTVVNFGWEGPITSLPVLPEPILQDKARDTTFINIHMNSLLYLTVKNFFLEFLSDFHIGEYQYWNIKVEHKKKILNNYSLFHLSYPSQERYVDYKNSEFYIGKLTDWQYRSDDISILNHKNYLSTKEVLINNNLYPKCNSIVFDLSNVKEDMFRLIDTPGDGYYVSERLRNGIERNNYTGMAFKEIEEVDKRIKVIY